MTHLELQRRLNEIFRQFDGPCWQNDRGDRAFARAITRAWAEYRQSRRQRIWSRLKTA